MKNCVTSSKASNNTLASTLDNSWEIQELDTSAFILDHPWNSLLMEVLQKTNLGRISAYSESSEFISSGLGRSMRNSVQQSRLESVSESQSAELHMHHLSNRWKANQSNPRISRLLDVKSYASWARF